MAVFNDLYYIEESVKEYDPLLSITYDEKTRKYTLWRNQHNVMSVDRLDVRVLRTLRKNDLHRRKLEDYIRELEASEDESERCRAREISSRIEDISLDKFDYMMGIRHFNLGGI